MPSGQHTLWQSTKPEHKDNTLSFRLLSYNAQTQSKNQPYVLKQVILVRTFRLRYILGGVFGIQLINADTLFSTFSLESEGLTKTLNINNRLDL